MLKEFKEFIARGNVIDMAIGVVMGGAFGAIVTRLVEDIIMPIVGLATSGVNFSDLYFNLTGNEYATLAEAEAAGAAVIKYGSFIQSIIDFLIIAFLMFLFIKQINRLKREKTEDPTTKDCPYCKSEIAIEATRCPNCTSELEA